MKIEQVLSAAQGKSEQEQLAMILSNRIDHTGAAGGLISVKQFDALVADILHWRSASTAAQVPVAAQPAEEGAWW